MKQNILYGVFIIILIGCESESKNDKFSGEFNGFWAETVWHYKFYSNNKFEFKCEGHFGFIKSKGIYERRQDSLFLMPNDTTLAKYGVVNALYLIDGDSCIIDAELKYDYCKTRKWSKERALIHPTNRKYES
ncbi:MAG: hypothetical protein P1U56_18030 [Saprospiraceae bacterium]|nr:hypothetical protein [Saprospiraceae bacterium]